MNLRKIFTWSYDYLPEEVDSLNCIYKITNKLNRKIYIGQASWFYGRFVANGWISHLTEFREYCTEGSTNRRLYNALKKYKCRNFDVTIIEDNLLNRIELNEREIYWISRFDSFNNGYNMTSGGDNVDALTSELALQHNRDNHGGVLSWNTLESITKSLETRRLKYNGDTMGGCHTAESYNKIRKIIASQYNEDPYGQLHTDEAITNQVASKLLTNIEGIMYDMKFNGWKLSPDNYYYHSGYSQLQKIRYHINSVLDNINTLRKDPNWTNVMEDLFQYFDRNRDIYGLKDRSVQ